MGSQDAEMAPGHVLWTRGIYIDDRHYFGGKRAFNGVMEQRATVRRGTGFEFPRLVRCALSPSSEASQDTGPRSVPMPRSFSSGRPRR